jgi:uncharacterized repeat protein (TIGR01451 family)
MLTYTLTLAGSGQTIQLWDPLPSSLHYVPDSITSTATPAAVYSPTVRAVVWGGTLPTNTIQTIQFQATPHITAMGALSVPHPIANTAWLTDTQAGTSISATVGVAVLPDPLFLGKQAAPRDGLRNSDTLTYTLTLSGTGQTVRLWDPLPTGVHYVTDSITGTVAPSATYSPTAHTVVWEGTLPIDTVHTVQFQVTPGVTGTGAASLSPPIVNWAWLTVTTGLESGRSLSKTVIVNGKRYYLPLVLRRYP